MKEKQRNKSGFEEFKKIHNNLIELKHFDHSKRIQKNSIKFKKFKGIKGIQKSYGNLIEIKEFVRI